MPPRNLINQKFNRLLVLEQVPSLKKHSRWKCLCDCGKETLVLATNLKRGEVKSCGCLAQESLVTRSLKHGHDKKGKRTKEYNTWINIKKRCLDPKSTGYCFYGAKGITVDKSWIDSFETFLKDVGFAPSPNYSIDRIDHKAGYTKSNVRWATTQQQGQEHNSFVKLTWEKVNEIRKLFSESNLSRLEFCRQHTEKYKVSMYTIEDVLKNKTWKI